jgi:hypothetical protein
MQKTARSFKELGSIFGLEKKVTATILVTPKKQPGIKKQAVQKVVNIKPVATENVVSPQYEVLNTVEGVVIKVPKKSGFMSYQAAFTAANGQSVSERWHNGRPLGNTVWFNINFYGIKQAQLGKRIEATIKTILKRMPDGTIHKMLDVYYTPGAECKYEFKMLPDGNKGELIDERVAHRIYFKPRKHNRLRP